ncbi:MAG: hypothetical protein ABL863_00085 [Nitrosomonas sp.]
MCDIVHSANLHSLATIQSLFSYGHGYLPDDQHETCSTPVNLFATARTVAGFE